jgi:hypothetical protein
MRLLDLIEDEDIDGLEYIVSKEDPDIELL